MKAKLTLLTTEEGGRQGYILPGYRPSFRTENKQGDCYISEFEKIYPGETGNVTIHLLFPERFIELKEGDEFTITEGSRKVAHGIIIEK